MQNLENYKLCELSNLQLLQSKIFNLLLILYYLVLYYIILYYIILYYIIDIELYLINSYLS